MNKTCPKCNSPLEPREILVSRTTSPEEDDKFEMMDACIKCDYVEGDEESVTTSNTRFIPELLAEDLRKAAEALAKNRITDEQAMGLIAQVAKEKNWATFATKHIPKGQVLIGTGEGLFEPPAVKPDL